MYGIEENGIQSIPPRYDENNSFYVYTSEGYEKAVEKIEAEERDIADAELIAEAQQRLDSDEIERLESINREDEKRILEEIRLKEKQSAQTSADLSEYELQEEILPGVNVDFFA